MTITPVDFDIFLNQTYFMYDFMKKKNISKWPQTKWYYTCLPLLFRDKYKVHQQQKK